jgi:hypothetical protein
MPSDLVIAAGNSTMPKATNRPHLHSATSVRLGGLVIVAAVILVLVSCSGTAVTVTPASQTGVLPISPEGVWHDLEMLAQHPVRKPIESLFSRRHLMERVAGREPPPAPLNAEEYTVWLRHQESELSAHQEALADYGEHVRDVLRRLLRRGTSMTYPPEYPQPKLLRNDAFFPEGPNQSIVVVEYWTGATGVGKKSHIEVELVQEYEEWRIDRLTPDPFAIPPGGAFEGILAEIPATGRRGRSRE